MAEMILWFCGYCRGYNDALFQNCARCGKEECSDNWACPSCGVGNRKEVRECVSCHKRRPLRAAPIR